MIKEYEKHIKRCFELALWGVGKVSPNPLVGAVIVKDDKVIAEGYHKAVGLDHAELDAIKNASCDLKGATLYCNLEPCCHTNKRTPPCAQRIIKEGITKVVIANLDPNPEVAGNGVKLMEEAGIEVITGILKDEGKEINEIFFHHITQKKPFVHLKMAQTLDGKLASKNKDSKWITSEESRANVHQIRENYDAIMVGANTVREDNPTLTVRIPGKETKGILRIILSLSGELKRDLNIFNDEFKHLTYVIIPTNLKKIFPFQTITCDLNDNGEFNLEQLLNKLYLDFNIKSLFVEGGQLVHTSFIHQHLYNKISVFVAPKILGSGHETIGDLGSELIADAVQFENAKWKTVGPDIVFTALRRL